MRARNPAGRGGYGTAGRSGTGTGTGPGACPHRGTATHRGTVLDGPAAARSRAPRWGSSATAALAGLVALASLVLLPSQEARASAARQPAAESSGYRYWSFWQRQEGGSWSYATEGPATQRPEDGDVLGFRFALSEDSDQADEPRGAVRFATACDGTKAGKESKRVAVRIDFGTRADAPGGESGDPPAARTGCARIPENGTAADALAKVASPLRYNSDALLCAIDGYPATGCGEQAKGSGGSGKSEDGDGDSAADTGSRSADGEADGGRGDGASTAVGVAAGAAAVAILGAAALWQARRRKR
ncbi:SCO2322 family protein [Streptomyces sp. NPDC006990]|uniref:SCO2322 family protein n=1 Tax=Streptomyces sp. NPDC006990 TaxID=3154481 RepID=UPI003455EC5A